MQPPRIALILIALTIIVIPAHAATYYLSSDGDDAAAGTQQNPWRSLEHASGALQAGDTLILRPGSYPGTLSITTEASAEAPTVVRAEQRRTPRLTADGEEGFAVDIQNAAHVQLEGLWMKPEPMSGRWLRAANSSHIEIRDCLMEDATPGLPFRMEHCDQVRILDSVIREHIGGNMGRVAHSSHVLFEGCSISRTGHCPLQFYPDGSNSSFVLRGNVFHSAWGRNFAFRVVEHMLFENNIVTNAFNGGRSAGPTAKYWPTPGLFRFNRVFHNPHGALNTSRAHNARYYNNVFDHNIHHGYLTRGNQSILYDVTFSNNIFSRNDWLGGWTQLAIRNPEAGLSIVGNNIIAEYPGQPGIINYGDDNLSVEEANALEKFSGNVELSPGYVNAQQYNHALAADSPLRDASAPLTEATGQGEGTVLPVADPWYFYDGYGIDGEQGDVIAVGDSNQRARIVEVDHANSSLVLDRSVQWSDGDPVSLPWSGAGIDMGVYEHGPDGRPSVQVVVEPFEIRPGDDVTVRAVLHGGIEAQNIHWHLGDGTVAEGPEITHSYSSEYDYAIRVRVDDEDGRMHRGTGYVVVKEPVDPSAPLIHTTWEPDDETAWWLWKSYRPFPAAYNDTADEETGRAYRHVYAPEDGGRLPAQIHPRGWEIDHYPRIFIRYRVGNGVPVAIRLLAFSNVQGVFNDAQGIVAASPGAKISDDERLTDRVLEDDEQWHELEIDARVIRKFDPDAAVLEGMRIGAAPREDVKKGDWYDLDEVIIEPER